jgi:phage shock protein A
MNAAEADPSVAQAKKAGAGRHSENYKRLKADVERLTGEKNRLSSSIGKDNESLARYKAQLVEFERVIQALDRETADYIARLVTAKERIALNQKLAGISTSANTSLLDKVRDGVAKMEARAELAEELSGATVSAEDSQYLDAGATDAAVAEHEQARAAENAERELKGKARQTDAAVAEGSERPKF